MVVKMNHEKMIKNSQERAHWQHGGGISDAPNLNHLFGEAGPEYQGPNQIKPVEYGGKPVQ